MSKRPYQMHKSEDSFDFLSSLHFDDSIERTIQEQKLDDLQNFDLKLQLFNYAHQKSLQTQSFKLMKNQPRNPPIASENCKFQDRKINDNDSVDENYLKQTCPKENLKLNKGKIYSKTYREKKKEITRSIDEENKFLKKKIQDLQFRLRQTELELNKLKHSQFKPPNLQTMKQKYMKEIEEVFQNKECNQAKIRQMQEKFTHLNTLSCKQKMDLLTYFRNQFFDVLISDVQFYLLNGLIEKKGLSRSDETVQPSMIDYEVYQIYNIENFSELQIKKIQFPEYGMVQIRKYKQLIQTLYQDYCKVISQGNLIERMWQPPNSDLKSSKVCKQTENFLKLQIYFETIKYRKDMRQLRESWFIDPQKQESNKRKKSGSKKIIKH